MCGLGLQAALESEGGGGVACEGAGGSQAFKGGGWDLGVRSRGGSPAEISAGDSWVVARAREMRCSA